MDAQNKQSVIKWSSYVGVLGTFVSVWMTGALDFVEAYGPFFGLTPLQLIFVPLVGIGFGLAISEGIARVGAGAKLSEYVKAGTEEAEKFLQAGLGIGKDTAKRITKQWSAKAGQALDKLKTKVTSSFSRVARRGETSVRQARAREINEIQGAQFPAPSALLAEFWQAAHQAFTPPKARVRVAAVSTGRASAVTIFPIAEYNPKHVESRQAYLKRRTKVMIALAILVVAGFLTTMILKLAGVTG